MKMENAATPLKSIRLRFKNPRYERIIRLNTESIARKMGFCDDAVFDIMLAVEEAYTNAIEHSGRPMNEIELEVCYQIFADRLEVSVQDSGIGFTEQTDALEPAFPTPFPDPTTSDRGRGLGLIRHLADRTVILSQPGIGTLIRITKFLAEVSPGERPVRPAP